MPCASRIPGGLAGGVTPVPIPNTEVKPSKADDTAAVRQWDSRTLPGFKRAHERNLVGLFLLKPGSAEGAYVRWRDGSSEAWCGPLPGYYKAH